MWLLDSNILIYAYDPNNRFLDEWVESPEARMSEISIPEVLGFANLPCEERQFLEQTLAKMELLGVSEPVLRAAAEARSKRRLSLGDAIIAATAQHFDLPLVTRNVRDFRGIEKLLLINPFEAPNDPCPSASK